MQKVLITGGAGFIGGHLANALAEKKFELVLLDNFTRGVDDDFLKKLAKLDNVRILNRNLLLAESFNDLSFDFDYIFHFAAIIGVKHVLEKPYSVLNDNVVLLNNTINFARKQKFLKRFFFTSSSEIMAGSLLHLDMPLPTPEDFPIALTDLKSPRTSYMLSKIYGEALCIHSGLPYTLVRPHNIYGPRMGLAHVIPELSKKVYESVDGSNIQVASLNHSRAMCYVDDAVEILIKLMNSENSVNGVFNLGNQETEIKISELAEIIINLFGKKLYITPGNEIVDSPSRRCPDMSKTIAITGYTPKVGLMEGVEKTIHWYVQNVFNQGGISAS
ncbi:NAD-dependent epimerase/dehydratase family protein [Leptospira weilii]|uniref:NAD-binding protein n=1 Tax=Leptospira weilii str. UI 13098 TaxID=1088542 RepID=M6QP92_9LEPT|nr:NAD-dependent epimerase/dehydratase family protein [Leptospira weilii]EMN90692.1 NAD-binding protein [Leptospira weilii str. UI 13098]ULH30120.1 NAD-dependent epimerase/dehydratase family protein [Leptospira weilii]